MNRRQFLSRAALALGGALLAPLVGGAVEEAEAAGDDYSMDEFVADFKRAQANYAAHPPVWVKAFDPADIERAFAEPVETWDFPTTTALGTATIETWTYTGWREVGDA